MNIQDQEERDFIHTSDAEWDAEDARDRGSRHQDQCWILSDRDVWHRNPYYTGPDVPHPEEHHDEDEILFDFTVAAGKYDEDGENTKYVDSFATLDEAIKAYFTVTDYPWARIEYKGYQFNPLSNEIPF